ncbi:MAG: lytic transglycosylase domain-containing protein [Sulfurovum sp.]|nr:MAG: lytic transglycosylase domain-containing protein [Sulfurovum sp.]
MRVCISLCLGLFFHATLLQAQSLDFATVHAMPKSVEKDYYIWRFLSRPQTTAIQARKIILETSHLNKKLRVAYKRKTKANPPFACKTQDITPDYIWKNRSAANKYFKQGLALLRANNPKLAANYFDASRKYYQKRYEKDKALFWLYLSTHNKTYLKYLQKSYSVNIYTLLAADAINGTYPKTITEEFRKKHLTGFDPKNPIIWATIKQRMRQSSNRQIDHMANYYAAQDSIGIYTYLKAEACEHTKSYFPVPYRDAMRNMSASRQALIYAIARQESRFVPASVSRSFALGMMQFMPFLIKDIAKKKGYHMDLDEMFNPYRAIEFADYHLNYLNKYLYHPLFVAYAYNAGIGFTKRYLQNSSHFRRGAYEPYMSIETMKNAEAREYGKKVLANYVIYLNKLGVSTRITPLIKVLATPSQTDAFRK